MLTFIIYQDKIIYFLFLIMSVERYAIAKLRDILNRGKVHEGVVKEVGLTTTVTHRDIRHIPFSFIDEEIVWITEEPAFKVILPDGSSRKLLVSSELPVEVGDRIKFGEKWAFWEKMN